MTSFMNCMHTRNVPFGKTLLGNCLVSDELKNIVSDEPSGRISIEHLLRRTLVQYNSTEREREP
jgi:hypothetical protein